MILFVCSQGNIRSRTGELLSIFGGLDARSAGTDADAWAPVTDKLIRAADLVVCMMPEHKKALKDFAHCSADRVVVLGIEDAWNRLDPLLVKHLVFQMEFHNIEVADALKRGAEYLERHPEIESVFAVRNERFAEESLGAMKSPKPRG